MPLINPEGRLTRKERLVTVIALIGALLVHLLAIFGWGRMYQWSQEEQKKERLMVIRRVRDIGPPRETIPAAALGHGPGPAGTKGAAGEEPAPPPPPDPKVREQGPEPPKETELSPTMEEELQEQQPEPAKLAEHGENVVSVVTDLAGASFIVGGPAEYRGSGTMWVRKGAPPGKYTVTFNPVAGYSTPPVQTKELVAKGQIVFVGKYRRSTELVVDSNDPGARVTIYRPDGRPLDLNRPGRALLDDLPRRELHRGLQGCAGAHHAARRSRARSLPAASSPSTASTRTRPPAATARPAKKDAAAAGRGKRYGAGRESGSGSGARHREQRRKISRQNRVRAAGGRSRPAGADGRHQLPPVPDRGRPRHDSLPGSDHPQERFSAGVVPGLPDTRRQRSAARCWMSPSSGRDRRNAPGTRP